MAKKKTKQRSKAKKIKRRKSSAKWLVLSALFLGGLGYAGYQWYDSHEVEFVVKNRSVLAESLNNNSQNFIDTISPSAVNLASAYDLFPSVMVAQAILESHSGQSGLAHDHFNLFGIKGAYKGGSVSLKTWEDDGKGTAYTIYDTFRVYSSWYESLEDYANVLQQPHFSGVHRSVAGNVYDATSALVGVYATDTAYAEKLRYIIQTYGLESLDGGGTTLTGNEDGTVWNKYRKQNTTRAILNEDIAWAKRTGTE
jgi:N-acetylmuramoyl-L-alanine amidase